MCWGKRLQFSCGCEEVQQVRFCEWAAMPWLVNVAHPKGLPMQPIIDILPVKRECKACAPGKGKGKAGEEKKEGGKAAEGKEGGENEGESDEDAEGEEISDDEWRAIIGEGSSPDQYQVASGFWASLSARLRGGDSAAGGGFSAASSGGGRASLDPVPEEDEDEDDEEGGARIA
ncbi:hypothetical protein BKA64DRAFT_636149 [Cadophora sp. MPI-SDFR-AT-0126]|nr:hypothetical protein BKA64DRAFT_636149 [Leotiomycetes sp. MPI-SDFR-AT-0126]